MLRKYATAALALLCTAGPELRSEYPYLTRVLREFSGFEWPVRREEVIVNKDLFLRLYYDCDFKTYENDRPENLKSISEVMIGRETRKGWEGVWTGYFYQEAANSFFETGTTTQFYDPLDGKGRLSNNFNDPRIREGPTRTFMERHEASDIFARLWTPVHAVKSGLVVATGDNWKGRRVRVGRRYRLVSEGGLSKNSGNTAVIFHPMDRSYSAYRHLQGGLLVKTGDVVGRGKVIGYVGRTGNAIAPGVKPHLHLDYKEAGTECGVPEVLVTKNAYNPIREARLAAQNRIRFAASQRRTPVGSY